MTPSQFQPIREWIERQQPWMQQQTEQLARINSGTFNREGVNAVGERLRELAAPLAAECQVIALPSHEFIDLRGRTCHQPLGDAIRLRKRPEAPRQILLCGHMDTVFAQDDPFQQVVWRDDNTLHGPGVTDMKGGLVVMLTALMALEQHPLADGIGWEVIFNPDEEIGSPCSADLLREAAARAQLGLVFEPALPDGSFAGERKGSGNFTVIVRGRSAHAGRNIDDGRNALRALCDFVSHLDDLNGQRDGVTLNPARLCCDGALNRVPDLAVAQFNVRTTSHEDEHWVQQQLARLCAGINGRDGYSLQLVGSFSRTPKKLSASTTLLFETLQLCGKQLEIPVHWKATGGCCDGNNLAAAGLPNIDTLGVEGAHIHSADECLYADSLSRRATLTALLLLELAGGRLDFQLWPHLQENPNRH